MAAHPGQGCTNQGLRGALIEGEQKCQLNTLTCRGLEFPGPCPFLRDKEDRQAPIRTRSLLVSTHVHSLGKKSHCCLRFAAFERILRTDGAQGCCVDGLSSATMSPLWVLEARDGLGRATTALLCSEGHVWGERAGTGNAALWGKGRDDDEGQSCPWTRDEGVLGLLGITKMTAFSCAVWAIGTGHLCVGHRLQ